MIKISEQGGFSEQGKRKNNEDKYVMVEDRAFIVCDGVGGAEKGEIASEIVASSLEKNFLSEDPKSAEDALRVAESEMSAYRDNHPESAGMATTLTICNVKSEGILALWCGDSRIYQFRNGEIVFVSKDHSWVNEAVKAGILSAEEAISHPKKNIITRSVQGVHQPAEVDSVFLTDIQAGDFFLQCTDGVLEAWRDKDLCGLFRRGKSVEELLDVLKTKCAMHSRDNFTAIIFEIASATLHANESIASESVSENHAMHKGIIRTITLKGESLLNRFSKISRRKKSLFYILLLMAIAAFAYFMRNSKGGFNNKTEKHPTGLDGQASGINEK